jgi:hypothetical protein
MKKGPIPIQMTRTNPRGNVREAVPGDQEAEVCRLFFGGVFSMATRGLA